MMSVVTLLLLAAQAEVSLSDKIIMLENGGIVHTKYTVARPSGRTQHACVRRGHISNGASPAWLRVKTDLLFNVTLRRVPSLGNR